MKPRRRDDLSLRIIRIYCVLIANMHFCLLMERLIYFALPNLRKPNAPFVGLVDKTHTPHKVQILFLCICFTWVIYLTNLFSHMLLQRAIKF